MRNVFSLKRRHSRRDSFEHLVRPHFDALYAAARRLTLSLHDAEDLVQDVCLKAFSRLGELKEVEFQRAWLLKVLYHEFIDGQRRNQRSPLAIAARGMESQEPDSIAAVTAQPDELVDHNQRTERVLWAMNFLNSDQCALIAMHDVEGFSIAELCALTGAPAGTIKAQLHRTRIKLGRLLSNDAIAEPKLKVVGASNEL